MTEMLDGSRFLGADLPEPAAGDRGSRYLDEADQYDNVIEYTPRHLRAAPLSRELQEALDAAFAPAYEALAAFSPEEEPLPEPEPESMPLPEPVPTPAPVAEEITVEVEEPNPADDPLPFVIPETVEYPAVLPGQAAAATMIPEAIFRDEVVTEPEPAPEIVIELPAPAARTTVPTPEHTPVSPTPFPEREHFADHDDHEDLGRRKEKKQPRPSRRIRPMKVDVSRLMVPSPPRIANG